MPLAGTSPKVERGIGYWMERVLAERERALKNFDPDAVHDLRTALRRCRSMAEGFENLDGSGPWKKMRRAGKVMFSALGELRDTQVLLEWIERLEPASPAVAERLRTHCRQREAELKSAAAAVVNEFSVRRWMQWARQLQERAQLLEQTAAVFEVLALERYEAARQLHSRALRNRSKAALHQLRIGIKKFRYIIENFLPQHHERWGQDLKQLQDTLGDIHDLDVLVDTARQTHALVPASEGQPFLAAVKRERETRLHSYRQRMVGPNSLWREWRSGLPAGEMLQQAVLKRFEVWAHTLDPNPRRTQKVAHLSLLVYDSLRDSGLVALGPEEAVRASNLLKVAALAQDVGRVRGEKAHHKNSARLLRKLEVPPGWRTEDLAMAALVARYHRGALPAKQKSYEALPPQDRRMIDLLAGILRLADSLAGDDDLVRRVRLTHENGVVKIAVAGFHSRSKQTRQVGASRCLLEETLNVPVFVREFL